MAASIAFFSPPRLHPPVARTSQHQDAVRALMAKSARPLATPMGGLLRLIEPVRIPLTTVSLNTLFDAYIDVRFEGAPPTAGQSMIVDSGSSVLIVPRWEDIRSLSSYTVIGESPEPWGCPAKVVRGPILLDTLQHGPLTIPNCLFYACYADNPDGGGRTANFGAGLLSPWTASGWNELAALGVVLQSPLSYLPNFPVVEFDYEPAKTILGTQTSAPQVASGSALNLYSAMPTSYQTFDIVENLAWMSLIPSKLAIEGRDTGWPGTLSLPPIAMIDTGGGPVLVSDPNGFLVPKVWPEPATNPAWISNSTSCASIQDALAIALGDASGGYRIAIDPGTLPTGSQGLSMVACEVNEYLRGQQGLNIGGISALFNFIAIDHASKRVGFRPKASETVT